MVYSDYHHDVIQSFLKFFEVVFINSIVYIFVFIKLIK